MTVTGDAPATAHTDSQRPGTGAGRFESWRAGWRVALRMARRDVRRHRGRSLLIVVMVGLPVLLLTAGSTLWFSEDLDTAERLPLQIGQTQGFLVGPQPQVLQQLIDPQTGYGSGEAAEPAKPVPGYGPGTQTKALEALVGGRLHQFTISGAVAQLGKHFVSIDVLGFDGTAGSDVALAPKVSLTSGRWPATADEVVVTPNGASDGLPTSGTLELRNQTGPDGKPVSRTVTVVGVGEGHAAYGAEQVSPVELITVPSTEDVQRQWLVERSTPITWSEVQRLNTYGIGVYSRYVVEHPETVVVPLTEYQATRSDDLSALYAVGGASFGLLLLTTLLAGPAFAVSAARQRHTLALAASNGATRAQLRRSVLAQALVLGVISAVAGAVLGVLVGLGGARLVNMLKPWHFFGPLQVPWSAIVIVAASGVVSSVIAALIPSRGLGKLDIISVLRGQSVSPRLRRRLPVLGAVLAGAGVGLVLLASFNTADQYFYVFLGGVLLIIVGALLLVPLVLALGARLSSHLPLAPRMAARDAGRLRGRATPTVAAIMAGAAALTTACIALQADTIRGAKQYQPSLLAGEARIEAGGFGHMTQAEVKQAIRVVDPGLTSLQLHWITEEGQTSTRVAAVVPGCTVSDTLPEPKYRNGMTMEDGKPLPRCTNVSLEGSYPGTQLVVADLDELTTFDELTDEQRSTLAAGGVAILDPAVAATLPVATQTYASGPLEELRPVDVAISNGSVSFYRYSMSTTPEGELTVDDRGGKDRVALPVVRLSHEQWLRMILYGNSPGAIITTATAERLGLTVDGGSSFIVRGPSPISTDQESRLNDAIRAQYPDASITVERGYQRSDALIVGIAIGVIALVILVATLIATALGQAEAAPLLGTLAAVGATRRTRRQLAAAQAMYLALIGAVLGVLVGLAPGIAISRIITATYDGNGGMDASTVIISVPWLQVLVPVLLTPVVAGALAWVSIRRAPMVTRRAT